MIQASIGPCAAIVGRARSPTFASTASSDQADWLTKCIRHWCWADTRAGAVTAASGSTLLRSKGSIGPVQ